MKAHVDVSSVLFFTLCLLLFLLLFFRVDLDRIGKDGKYSNKVIMFYDSKKKKKSEKGKNLIISFWITSIPYALIWRLVLREY